jgi:hypothetical protein
MKSRIETEEPRRMTPYSDAELPTRMIWRTDKELANAAMSRSVNMEPNLANP